jgi:hypothetical protein
VRLLLVVAPVCALLAAGCGGNEGDGQRLAREATESYLSDNDAYEAGEVRCTGNPSLWFVERQTTEFICAARRANGGCDWFRVELVPVSARVAASVELESRDAGCVLPP